MPPSSIPPSSRRRRRSQLSTEDIEAEAHVQAKALAELEKEEMGLEK
jgi:hypothetical protein